MLAEVARLNRVQLLDCGSFVLVGSPTQVLAAVFAVAALISGRALVYRRCRHVRAYFIKFKSVNFGERRGSGAERWLQIPRLSGLPGLATENASV